ncbi:MAG: thiazole synthase, partial [Verrucomicrobiota bacterium]|nr:thiazole synthase [Verrucomicrobiota bacterium]
RAVKAGRIAFEAGLMSSTNSAIASSPLTSFLSSYD